MSRRTPWDHRKDPGPMRALQSWGSRAAFDASMGLAFSRSDPGDVGPEILVWQFGLDDSAAETIVPRLAVLILLEAQRARIPITDSQGAAIVVHALRSFRGENCGAMAMAASRAGMRRESFVYLQDRVQRALWGALPGSLERFLATFAQDAA